MKWLASLLMILVAAASSADELVIFHRPECLGCRQLHAGIEAGDVDTSGWTVKWVDCSETPDAAKAAGVKAFPTSVLMVGSRATRRYVGFNGAADYERWLHGSPRVR